tara:strand:- start:11182 stop:12081 length:900 start_codon:yes stop_codon:yes gene_type:complete
MARPSTTWLTRIAPCPSAEPDGFPIGGLCGQMDTSAGWVEPNRVIYDHQLVLFERGHYRLLVDDMGYDCPEHSFIIIPPGHWHTTTCLENGRRSYAHFDWQYQPAKPNTPVMTFHPARPKRQRYRHAPDFVPNGVIHGAVSSPLVCLELMTRLSLMLGNDQTHERLAGRGVLLELLIRLLDSHEQSTRPQNRQAILAHKVRCLLDQTMSQQAGSIAIRPLLASIGHSYEHLARVFCQQYGLTPMDYVQSIRIERAKHLLRHTDDKLTAIAQAVGYQDAIYFSRLFKRLTNMTPGTYRKG